MAVIQAIFNPTTECWNPLDPKNWEGGVVPGKEDVARFKRFQTVYSSYENNYTIGYTYGYSANSYLGGNLYPHHFNTGVYSSSKMDRIQRQFPGIVNDIPGGTNAWSGYAYGSSGNDVYHKGFYSSINSNSTLGTSHSYNSTTDNQWKYLFNNTFNVTNVDRLPNRYFLFASTYRLNYNGVNDTSFTVDGVTIAEPLGLTGETYFTRSRAFGVSKEDWLAANEGYPMTDRIVDLFTGSALHVSNGGRWEIRGPHNGRGLTSNNDSYLNNLNCFTIFTTTGSEYRNSSHTSGPSFGGVSAANNNMTRTDVSSYLRAAHAYGFVTGGFSGSGDTLRNLEHPIWFPEGTASIKYGVPGQAASSGYYSKFITGSGHLYSYTSNMMYQGVGPGNHQFVKLTFDDPQTSYMRHIKPDPAYCLYTTESVIHVPLYAPLTGSSTYKVNGPIRKAIGYWTDTIIQKWELTGSQHWEVGRIEMAGFTHFHVKDQSKITIYDLEDSTYYPSIDMYDYAIRPTLLVTDQATIHLSSSRTSLVPNYESGIYQRADYTSVIISGSANYSSSVLTEAANAGDTTIRITDAQDNFGVGDYISLESTGSIKIKAIQSFSDNFIDENNPNTWWSASNENYIGRHSEPQYNTYNRPKTDVVGGYTDYDSKYYVERSYDHAFETDEIIQIMSMSGDYITVGKMYGKEGEIQADMGLYTHNAFTETFDEAPETNYTGTKRVVLVDSTHLNFQRGDNLVISGSTVCTVLHATTYLSQSNFYEFTSSNQPALNQVFDLLENDYSASSIYPTNSSTYGVTQPSTYFAELYMKDRLLITGSYRGSRHFPDSASFISNAYSSLNYGQKSGSNQGYRSLQLDPTLAYTWYNPHPSYRMDRNDGNAGNTYKYHSLYSTNYISGRYQLKDTSNFQRGEIIISGSLLRNGLYDPTSSQAFVSNTWFGVVNGEIPFQGPSRQDHYQSVYGDLEYSYNQPWPYADKTVISANYGGRVIQTAGTVYAKSFHFGNFPYSASGVSGSVNMYASYNNPGYPYRYQSYGARQFAKNYNEQSGIDIDMRPVLNSLTASWRPMTASIEQQRGIKTGGSCHLRIIYDDNIKTVYLGDSKAREVLIDQSETEMMRGRLSIALGKYASVHSINIKTKWQMLILDTQDSVTYRDKIKEGGLLYNQYANKRSKFIATEVVDPKGFKNLLWDYEYNKGKTEILPYLYATCYSGTTAGKTSLTNNQGYGRSQPRWGGFNTLIPRSSNHPSYYSYGQANDNFYIIYDFRTQVEFDTIGMVFAKDSYAYERDTNNQMNNVTFQVCDDIGVASPAWQTVVGVLDDTRRAANRGAIRFYTFPSGSVNKRYVKYHSRGGTSSTSYYMNAFFGAYNFSGSLDNAPPSASCVDAYGGPTSSICQVELANVKNFAVGDKIFFWSKQMNSTGHIAAASDNSTWQNYTNVQNMTGYYDKSTPDEQVLGGVNRYYDIIAINNNVVTLDRPITHEHIGVGTMAYKYNRGQVNLIGDRAAPFWLYTYSSDDLTQQLCNVTFQNGGVYGYNGNEYEGIRTYEDLGMFANQESYINQFKPGFYRNILCHGQLRGIPTANAGAPSQTLAFNVFMTYGNSDYCAYMYPRQLKNVINFCVNQARLTGGVRVVTGNYGLGHNVMSGTAYLQNTFMIGGYQKNMCLQGGISISRTYNAQSDVSKVIYSSNNIFPEAYNWNWRDNIVYGYGGGVFIDYGMSRRTNLNNNTNNTWYYPSVANARMRDARVGYLDTYTGRGESTIETYPGQGVAPIFFKGSQWRRFGDRDFVVIKPSNSTMSQIVKSKNFKTDGLFELYPRSTNPLNVDSGGSADTARHIACHFRVLEDNTPIRIDFDFIYKTTLQAIYGSSGYSSYEQAQYNTYGENIHEWVFENITTRTILDIERLTETELTTISTNKQYTLDKGMYTFSLFMKSRYYVPNMMICAFKDLNFKIVTPDVSKIYIQYSNMDVLKIFDNQDHYASPSLNVPISDSAGKNRVLRQTEDLTKIYKFNKIKL